MAAARDTTAANIKPLEGSTTRKTRVGATVAAGELITQQSDAKWDPTLCTGAQLTVRVAVQAGVDGDWIDAVTHGPVVCLTGATTGALIYGTDVAGEPGETAGTKSTIAGYAETATILFVQPQIVNLT